MQGCRNAGRPLTMCYLASRQLAKIFLLQRTMPVLAQHCHSSFFSVSHLRTTSAVFNSKTIPNCEGHNYRISPLANKCGYHCLYPVSNLANCVISTEHNKQTRTSSLETSHEKSNARHLQNDSTASLSTAGHQHFRSVATTNCRKLNISTPIILSGSMQHASSFLQPCQGYSSRTSQSVRYSSTEPTTLYEGLLNSQPVQLAEGVFQYAHSMTGLPWWGTLVATTFVLRLVLTLPLAVYSQNIRARVEALQPEVVAMAKRAFVERYAPRAKSEKWSEKRAQRVFVGLVKRYSRELYVRDNCHPAKGSILFLVQLPMWIFLSLSLRNMTGAFSERMYVDPASIVPDLTTGGALWFPSLAAPDPTLILPVLVGLLNLTNIEMHALHKGRVTRFQRGVNNTLRAISLVMIPVAAYVPAAMSLYWTVSALYGLGQNILLKIPSARQALGIHPSKTDSATPFTDMREEFVERYIHRTRGERPGQQLEEMEGGTGETGEKSKRAEL